MKLLTIIGAAAMCLTASAAHADCTPLKSDVVSLGQKAARFYSERSLTTAIDGERARLQATGSGAAKVTKAMDCKPYPNLIGADEWRCIGEAKVCAK